MSIFTFLIDAAVSNTYAMSKALGKEFRSQHQFKKDLAVQMCWFGQTIPALVPNTLNIGDICKNVRAMAAYTSNMQDNNANKEALMQIQQESTTKEGASISNAIGSIDSWHALVSAKDSKASTCYVCLICRYSKNTSVYTCTGCKKGYHVNCFSVFHNKKCQFNN